MGDHDTARAVPARLAAILEDGRLAPYRAAILASRRACWRLAVEPVARLGVGLLGRLVGRRARAPSLPRQASKRGGVPFLLADADWPRDARGDRLPFVSQINFAELPAGPDPAPRRGLFVLFGCRDDPFYVTRWYPDPGPSPADVTGPNRGDWEARLVAAPAVSVSFASFWDEDEITYPLDALTSWDKAEGGHLGSFTVGTLPDPETSWYGAAPAPGEIWVQLWDSWLEESFGTFRLAVVVRLSEFEAGHLDRPAVVLYS